MKSGAGVFLAPEDIEPGTILRAANIACPRLPWVRSISAKRGKTARTLRLAASPP